MNTYDPADYIVYRHPSQESGPRAVPPTRHRAAEPFPTRCTEHLTDPPPRAGGGLGTQAGQATAAARGARLVS
jgi:hypothetical protein